MELISKEAVFDKLLEKETEYQEKFLQHSGNGIHDASMFGRSYGFARSKEIVQDFSPIEAIPMELFKAAIDHVEEYICNKEEDTVKAQGMADALTMIEQFIKENGNE